MGSSAVNEWIKVASESAITVINTMALVFIVIGAVEAFVAGLRAMVFSRRGHERREIWLRFARWLVAGLTFSSPPTSSRPRSRPNGKRSHASPRSR